MSSVIQEYRQKLSELTFNNGPVISYLTQLAKSHPEFADQIMDLISERIFNVLPEQKLYTLYVLDDICKTVGNPYNILIGDELYKIFVHVFQLNNEFIRNKLVRMYETWKIFTIKNTNERVFSDDQLSKIGTFLKKAGYPKNEQSTPTLTQPSLPQKPIVSLQQSLINDIDNLIPIFEKQLRSDMMNEKLQERFKALNSLKTMLTTHEMKAAELEAIKSHIVNIQIQSTPVTPAPPPNPVIQSPIQKVNPAFQIFNDLILSGLVKKEQEPIPGSQPTYTLMFPEIKFSLTQNQTEISLEDLLLQSSSIPRSDYDKLKFTELMNVSKKSANNLQDFINNNVPSTAMMNLLYDAKPSKCSICGKRFTTDYDGTNKKRLHLDWHFRMNKKLGVKGANIQSRNWYLDDYEWVNFNDDNLLDTATENSTDQQQDITTTNEVNYVTVPSNDTNMNNRCLICREQVKAKYNDDIGEWVWYDCMRQPGDKNSRKIVHVSCFQEKKRSADAELQSPKIKRERII
ncbi:uncharacterized protein KGF55_002878 [Candida pseudojiufengensis]|uniref:uncharacterized protein n=1 Tax=Candida pseudojiufengensis TaxID=497109 RepID=UPI00222563B5|nr:uncharacterized protein KGF55_002878 [Candida pseudojiufengensis]KAI5963086.1 hypothetical protein KGF55_002878 [Candida pseudojiufengensis]